MTLFSKLYFNVLNEMAVFNGFVWELHFHIQNSMAFKFKTLAVICFHQKTNSLKYRMKHIVTNLLKLGFKPTTDNLEIIFLPEMSLYLPYIIS